MSSNNHKNTFYAPTHYILICNETDESKSYGIGCLKNGEVHNVIGDISPNKEKVEEMVELFNKEDLAPVHLKDVIEDNLPL